MVLPKNQGKWIETWKQAYSRKEQIDYSIPHAGEKEYSAYFMSAILANSSFTTR